MDDIQLPPPGIIRSPSGTESYFDGYTADQVRAAILADRERRQPAPSAKPVAWRTVVDDATHSVSVTKTAAEMRASLFREENRGRDFLVRVVPLYDAPQPAPSAEAVAWMTVEEDGTRHGLRYWREGTHREVPLYMAPPDHREVMRMALDAIVGYRRELADSQPCDAEILLRAVLGEPKR
jgi:hypothetical protein